MSDRFAFALTFIRPQSVIIGVGYGSGTLMSMFLTGSSPLATILAGVLTGLMVIVFCGLERHNGFGIGVDAERTYRAHLTDHERLRQAFAMIGPDLQTATLRGHGGEQIINVQDTDFRFDAEGNFLRTEFHG